MAYRGLLGTWGQITTGEVNPAAELTQLDQFERLSNGTYDSEEPASIIGKLVGLLVFILIATVIFYGDRIAAIFA